MTALGPDAIASVISLSTPRAHHPTWTRLRDEALQLPRSGPYSGRGAQQEDARAFPRIEVATVIPVALNQGCRPMPHSSVGPRCAALVGPGSSGKTTPSRRCSSPQGRSSDAAPGGRVTPRGRSARGPSSSDEVRVVGSQVCLLGRTLDGCRLSGIFGTGLQGAACYGCRRRDDGRLRAAIRKGSRRVAAPALS